MDEESRLFKKFANFSAAAKRDVVAAALEITNAEADNVIRKIVARLQYEESLKNYVASKTEISLKLAQEIDKIKMRKFGKKKKSSKKRKKILLHTQEIKQLRENKASWKDISTYLKKNYHISASWVWVRNAYVSLQNSISNEKD